MPPAAGIITFTSPMPVEMGVWWNMTAMIPPVPWWIPRGSRHQLLRALPDRVKPNQRNGIYGHGRERYDTVLKILAQQKDVLSPLTVWDALRAVAQEPDSKDITSNTQWSICFHNSTLFRRCGLAPPLG